MGLFNNFPYMDLSNLNLDFILREIRKLKGYQETASTAAVNAEESASAADNARQQAAQARNAAEGFATNAHTSARTAQQYADNIADPVSGLVTTWLDENIEPTTPPIDSSLTIQGAAADAKKTGDEIADLKSQITNGVPYSVKIALDNVLQNVAFKNDDGYASDLSAIHNWATSVNLVSISAVFTQGNNPIYDDQSLNDLKQYLVVTANYDDETTTTLADSAYTLSGTLEVGSSVITASYGGKTAGFIVTVSAGVPDTYAKYDYISRSENTTNDPAASWINLATYANLDALSFKLKFSPLTGYTLGGYMFGARNENDLDTGVGLYLGTSNASSLGVTDKLRVVAHGEHLQYTSNEMNVGQVNVVEFANTASSPSAMVLNGVSTEFTWSTQLTVNRAFSLFNNPWPDETQMNLRGFMQFGNFVLRDLSGNIVGDYVPVKRSSDNRLGMYDRVSQQFFTSSTASYTTVGNSNCKYNVGNWS